MADRRDKGIPIVVDREFHKLFKDIRVTVSKKTNIPFKSDKAFSSFLIRANIIQIKDPKKRRVLGV